MTRTEQYLLESARYQESVAARERLKAAEEARRILEFEGLGEHASKPKPKKYSEYKIKRYVELYTEKAKLFRIAKEHIDDAIYAAINNTGYYNISEEDIANAYICGGSVLETRHCKYPVGLFRKTNHHNKWVIETVSIWHPNKEIAWDDVDIVEAFWNAECRKAFDGGFRTGVFSNAWDPHYFTIIKGKYTDYYYMDSVAEALRKPLNEEKEQAYTLTRKLEKK